MPLVGIKDCCQGGDQPFDHCLSCAREMTCVHPLALIKYMQRNERLREGISYSATSIIGCARRHILQQGIPFFENPLTAVARFYGDASHDLTEKLLSGEDVVTERRLWKSILVDGEEFVLSGKPDQQWFDDTIIDLKNTGHIPKEPYPDHESQVNVYAWMHRGGWDASGEVINLDITRGFVTYMSPKGQTSVTHAVRIWSPEEQDAFIGSRLRQYLDYLNTFQLPPVLPATIRYAPKSGRPLMMRDFRCDYCPVREACDQKALEATGIDPNTIEYWIDVD